HRVLPLSIPALGVHAVDAVELEPAAFEVLAEGAGHPAVLPLEEPAHRGGEDEDACAGVAEHEEVHLAPERRAVPAVVLAVHGGGSMRKRGGVYRDGGHPRTVRRKMAGADGCMPGKPPAVWPVCSRFRLFSVL